ncbi:ATP-binding cassette domain-containing protein [Affinibrenneria salicis]|nr:ABC transporter ATP-binding protein [Affinibrenneria salicis]
MNNQTHPPLLAVEGLTLMIQGQRKINRISFTLHAGERLCLLGASGSGKSLTARCLLGVPPAHGQIGGYIRIQGHDVTRVNAPLRRGAQRLAAIFQDSSVALNPLVSVGKQLLMALRCAAPDRQSLRREAVYPLLSAVGFEQPADIARRYPAEISGGQRQRVCIALALACRSPLLVADEPTTALDMVTQAKVLRALQRCTRGEAAAGLLFITHDIAVAAALCERALVMSQGEIVEQGPLRDLLRNPRHPYTRSLVAAARAASLSFPPASAAALLAS